MHVTTEASLRNVRGQPSVKETGKQQRQGRADASLAVFKYVMAQALVTKAVQENAVMVFSKSYCPHCIRAKRILDTEIGKAKYSVMELESRPDGSAIQDYLSKLTGARTVPRVFIQGKCIGGGSETAKLQQSGRLKQLLKQVGASQKS